MQRWCRGVCEFQRGTGDNTPSGAQSSGRAGGGCISHPTCERVPQAIEGVDGAVPWGRDPLSEELSGLEEDVGALWEVNISRCSHETPHATRNWE